MICTEPVVAGRSTELAKAPLQPRHSTPGASAAQPSEMRN